MPFTLTWNGCDASNTTVELLAEAIPEVGYADASIADNVALTATLVTAPTGALTLQVDRSDTSAEDEHEVLYTFHYSNNGNAAAIGTWLSFVMPTGVVIEQIIPDSNEGASIDVGRGTLKSLLPNDTGSVVVRARVTGPVGAPGVATLNAGAGACGVTAPIVAPTLQPNDTGVHVLVSPSVGSTCAGEGVIDWTVTVTNPNGTATANTPISVTIPTGLEYVAGSIRGQGGIDVRAPETAGATNATCIRTVLAQREQQRPGEVDGAKYVRTVHGRPQRRQAVADLAQQRPRLGRRPGAEVGVHVGDQIVAQVTLPIAGDGRRDKEGRHGGGVRGRG